MRGADPQAVAPVQHMASNKHNHRNTLQKILLFNMLKILTKYQAYAYELRKMLKQVHVQCIF